VAEDKSRRQGGLGTPTAHPQQERIERATEYLARYSVVVIAVVLVSAVLAKLANADFPRLREVLDGSAILTSQDHPNYVRNFLELTSFLATTGVLVTAIGAFLFAKRQLEDAQDASLKTLLITLEARWASEEMLRSKALFAQMMLKYSQCRSAAAEKGEEAVSLPQFAHEFIMALQSTHQYDYFTLMALPEFLEYVGFVQMQGLVRLSDIDPILGMVFIQVASTLAVHIDHLRLEGAEMKTRSSLERAPEEFHCLSYLEGAFLERYRSAATPAP